MISYLTFFLASWYLFESSAISAVEELSAYGHAASLCHCSLRGGNSYAASDDSCSPFPLLSCV